MGEGTTVSEPGAACQGLSLSNISTKYQQPPAPAPSRGVTTGCGLTFTRSHIWGACERPASPVCPHSSFEYPDSHTPHILPQPPPHTVYLGLRLACCSGNETTEGRACRGKSRSLSSMYTCLRLHTRSTDNHGGSWGWGETGAVTALTRLRFHWSHITQVPPSAHLPPTPPPQATSHFLPVM